MEPVQLRKRRGAPKRSQLERTFNARQPGVWSEDVPQLVADDKAADKWLAQAKKNDPEGFKAVADRYPTLRSMTREQRHRVAVGPDDEDAYTGKPAEDSEDDYYPLDPLLGDDS